MQACFFTAIPPDFVQPIDRNASVGDTVNFTCMHNESIAHWNLNIRGEYHENLNYRTVRDIPNHRYPESQKILVITDVTLDDNDNTYQCNFSGLENPFCSRVATLRVQGTCMIISTLSFNGDK